MVMARFKVTSTFTIRSLFVIAGQIIDGRVQAGMTIQIPFNSELSLGLPIYGIEYVRHKEREDICLTVKYEDLKELDILLQLNISDETLEVIEE